MTPFNERVVGNICKFIKENHSLQLLDLSNTRLIDIAMRKIVRSLKKSPSLQSLHLSGNQNIDGIFVEKLDKSIHGAPKLPNFPIKILKSGGQSPSK